MAKLVTVKTIKLMKIVTTHMIYTHSSNELKQARALNLALLLTASLLFLSQPVLAQSANPHAVSIYNLGLSAYKQGSPESAIIFFKRACDIDPDLADAQYNLGVLYQSERRLKEAVTRFQEVLRIKPQDADAHYQLGLALIDLNRLPEAKDQFSAIASNSSHFVEAQKKLANLGAPASQAPAGVSNEIIARPEAATDYANANGSGANSAATANVTQIDSAGNISSSTSPSNNPGTSNGLQGQSAQSAMQTLGNVGATVAVVTPPISPPSEAQPLSQPAVQPPQVVVNQITADLVQPQPVYGAALLPSSAVSPVASGFSAPAGIAFDKQGNLYVANFLTSVIDRVGVDGIRRTFSSGNNIKGPIGLTVDDSGEVYVANWLNGTITRISPAGVSSVLVSGLKKPYYLTIDRDNNLLVSQQEDNSIVRVTLPKAVGVQAH